MPEESRSNAQRIAAALKAQGFSNVAIAGILGNLGRPQEDTAKGPEPE